MSCGVGDRCSSDPELLWLWCRLAAVNLIGHLAWEFLHTADKALKQKNKNKKKRRKEKEKQTNQPKSNNKKFLGEFPLWLSRLRT